MFSLLLTIKRWLFHDLFLGVEKATTRWKDDTGEQETRYVMEISLRIIYTKLMRIGLSLKVSCKEGSKSGNWSVLLGVQGDEISTL